MNHSVGFKGRFGYSLQRCEIRIKYGIISESVKTQLRSVFNLSGHWYWYPPNKTTVQMELNYMDPEYLYRVVLMERLS